LKLTRENLGERVAQAKVHIPHVIIKATTYCEIPMAEIVG
jgi:hypothetical protein